VSQIPSILLADDSKTVLARNVLGMTKLDGQLA
jgi:hypothetical protein